ncbi:MAG: fructosamine-3-kinase, partial [Myxococcota bacterium]
MPSQTPTWADVRRAWTSDWKATYTQARIAYSARILAAPASYTGTVEAFLKLVGSNGAMLQASRK